MSKRDHGRHQRGDPPGDVWSNAGAPAPRDICLTCNHTESCGHRGTPGRPIYFCEHFEAFAPVSTTVPTTKAPDPSVNNQPKSQYKGLCMNCEHREDCAVPKPEGGIWHCEEYC